jgi:hypothetical protein
VGEGERADADSLDAKSGIVFLTAGVFPIEAPSDDQLVLFKLKPGNYTAVISGQEGSSGEGLGEVYLLGYRSDFLAQEKAAK